MSWGLRLSCTSTSTLLALADLDAPGGKHLHYLFYESQTGNASDPLLLWFNGGPGCSSLEGAFSESGPLWSTTGGVELQVNEYSFNNFSHQLFIESPTCVGFSYNDATGLAACTHSDTSTAEDNLAALLAWFAGFPEYLPNELWITGESYAGIYVPTLAKNVVEHNANGSSPRLNLQGIMVGNGCLGSEVGVCSHTAHGDFLKVKQLAGHGFVSDEAWERALAACPTGDDWTRADAAVRAGGSAHVHTAPPTLPPCVLSPLVQRRPRRGAGRGGPAVRRLRPLRRELRVVPLRRAQGPASGVPC